MDGSSFRIEGRLGRAALAAGWVGSSWFLAVGIGCYRFPVYYTVEDGSSEESDASPDAAADAEAGAREEPDSSPVEVTTPDSSPIDAASPGQAGGDENPCTQDLSYIYTGPFSVSFTLKTLQPDMLIALVNQRSVCNVGVFWDIRLYNSVLYLELADEKLGITSLSSTSAPLNDGNVHDVAVSRAKGGLVTVTVDGSPSGSIMAMQSFDQLNPLQTGTDVCNGYNGSTVFHGTLTNVCVRPE